MNTTSKLRGFNAVVRRMNNAEKVDYAVYMAQLVLNVFENNYPKDKRPRKAIHSVLEYIKARKKNKLEFYAKEAFRASYECKDLYASEAARAAAYTALTVVHYARIIGDMDPHSTSIADYDTYLSDDTIINQHVSDVYVCAYRAQRDRAKEMLEYGLYLLGE